MSVDPKIFKLLGNLAQKNPKNQQADWFAMGFMFAYSMNNKPLEDIFNTVNNITLLSRMGSLSVDETNDILLRMMNNLIKTEKMSSGPQSERKQSYNGNNAANESAQASDKKAVVNGKSEKPLLRKSSTIELDGSDKTGLIEDFSYKSDDDLVPNQGVSHSGKNGKKDDDLLECDLVEEDYKAVTTTYIKKPVNQIDLSDIHKPVNLKRSPALEEEELSLELIKQLQEEDAKLQKMVEERKKKEEQAATDATCSICLSSLLDEAFLPLEGCIHIFHEGCFEEYLKSAINSRSFPIKCPSNCGQEVSEADVMQVLEEDFIQKFYEYSLQKYVSTHADEISCCPTPNCTYAFAQEEAEGDENILKCPLCKKTYCLNCRVDYHKGMSCKEYQITNTKDANDLKFEKFVKGKKYKQCSKCKFWVEKNQGCDHMTCRCKYEFCYKCGGKYRECECVKKMQEIAQRRQEQRDKRKQQTQKNKRRKR